VRFSINAHALIQHTLYDDLGTTRRARLHRAAAEGLEARVGEDPGARAGELARHWLAATRPTESSKAVTYARLAAEGALGSLAPAEAIRWYGEAIGALDLAPDDHERARCLAGLGVAQRQTGDGAYRETLLQAARLAQAVGDVDTLVLAALANNRGFQSGAGIVDAERVEMLTAALDAIGSADSPARCRLLALLALEHIYDGDYRRRRTLCDEALQIARRLGDPATLFDVLFRRGQAIWTPDTVDELLRESNECGALADQMGDPVSKFWAATFRGTVVVQVGDIAEVARCHEEAARLASDVGQPILKWTSSFNRSWSTLLAGDVAQAEALADEALQIGNDTGQPDTLTIYGAQLFSIRWHQGRLGEIADMVVQIVHDNPGVSGFRSLAALVCMESGRGDEARRLLDAERSSGFPDAQNFLVPISLDTWARVASHFGDRDAAEALYPRLARWPHLVGFTGVNISGAVALSLGTLATVLGRYRDAEAHFAEALRIHENLASPFFIAMTDLEWGRMLLSRREPDDPARAETTLRSALALAHRYGYAALEARAREGLEPSS